MNDEYKTFLLIKGLDLPSVIFEQGDNVDAIIKNVEGKIKRSREYIKKQYNKKRRAIGETNKN